MISSGKGVRCPSDGRKPKRVAILLCVGSRDRQIGREWCSKICCTVSAQHGDGDPRGAAGLPRLHLLHGHPHLRAVRDQVLLEEPGGVQGQVHQGAHRRGHLRRREAGASRARTRWSSARSRSRSTWWCTPSAWTRTSTTRRSPPTFGVELERARLPRQRGNAYGTLGETSRPGVFVAGAATGPETIDDSIAQAKRRGDGGARAACSRCARAPERQPRCSDERKRRACRWSRTARSSS